MARILWGTGRSFEMVGVILVVFLFIFAGIQAVIIEEPLRTLWCAISIILTVIPFVFEWRYQVHFPLGMKVLIPFGLLLHVGGGITRWYWTVPMYDKFAHVISSLALGLVLFSVYLFCDYFEYARKKPIFRKRIRVFKDQETDVLAGVGVMLVIFGLAWELAEYGIDFVYHTTYNFGLFDSVTDFAGDIIGLVVVLWIIHRSISRIPEGEHLDYLLTHDAGSNTPVMDPSRV